MKQNKISLLFLLLIHLAEENSLRDTDTDFYGSDVKNKITEHLELKEFYEKEEQFCKKFINANEKLLLRIDSYVQRYISLFLIASGLIDRDIAKDEGIIRAELEVLITVEDLAFLQNYSKFRGEPTFRKNFSKLDSILSNIIKLKKRSFFENTALTSYQFFEIFQKYTVHNEIENYLLLIIVMLSLCWIVYHFKFPKTFYVLVLVFMNALILWESLMTYNHKLKNAKIEAHVNVRNYGSNCDPIKQNWYSSVKNFIFGDQCVQYLKEVNRNPLVEVSLLECIIDTYGILIKQPAKIFGTSINYIAEALTGNTIFPLNWILRILFCFILFIFVWALLIPLILRKIKLSFFGGSVEFSNHSSRIEAGKTDANKRNALGFSKKLRPWTKSKRLIASSSVKPEKSVAVTTEGILSSTKEIPYKKNVIMK